jgi:hypothetical protein
MVTPWEDWTARGPSWRQLLEDDGWQPWNKTDEVEYWTRPGKNARDGLSASLGYGGTDLLHVFSSSVPGLRQNGNYNRWAYEVAMRHNGDFRAAARAKAEEGFGTIGRHAREHCGGDLRQAAWELAHPEAAPDTVAVDRTSGARVRIRGRSALQGTARRPACLRREVIR